MPTAATRAPICSPRTPQTHSELAETRAELEQLADDILAIKLLMDEEDEAPAAGANGAAYDGGAAWAGFGAGGLFGGAGGDSEGEGEDEALDVLQSLAALSRQLAADAAADDELVASIQRIEEEQEASAAAAAEQ